MGRGAPLHSLLLTGLHNLPFGFLWVILVGTVEQSESMVTVHFCPWTVLLENTTFCCLGKLCAAVLEFGKLATPLEGMPSA